MEPLAQAVDRSHGHCVLLHELHHGHHGDGLGMRTPVGLRGGGVLVGSAHGEGDSNDVWAGCMESEARRPDQRVSDQRVGWLDLRVERAGSGSVEKLVMSGSRSEGNTAPAGAEICKGPVGR
jgi:hypothetical protein